mgnify:CR=1 FL=1
MNEPGTKSEIYTRIHARSHGASIHEPNDRGYPDHADDVASARNLVDDGRLDELVLWGERAGGQRVIVDRQFRPGTGQTFDVEAYT